MVRSKRFFRSTTSAAFDIALAWKTDKVEFGRLVEGAVSAGNDETLSAAVAAIPPKSRQAAKDTILSVANSCFVAGRHATLVVVPCLVSHGSQFPDVAEVAEALAGCWMNFQQGASIAVVDAYWPLRSVVGLAPSELRGLVSSLGTGLDPVPPPLFLVPRLPSARGAPCAILALVFSDHPWVPGASLPGNLVASMRDLLHSGGGIVDVADPVQASRVRDNAQCRWFSAAGGALEEVDQFFAVATEACGTAPLCEMSFGPRQANLRLVQPDGAYLDDRTFDLCDPPITSGEMGDIAFGLSSTLVEVPWATGETTFRVSTPPPPRVRKGVPALRNIQGGVTVREAEADASRKHALAT